MTLHINPDADWFQEDWFQDLERSTDHQLVAIAGIPGSGKTTFAKALASKLDATIVVPMDGYHRPRCELSPADLARRGAPHTFDVSALKRDLEYWKQNRSGKFPAFDHAKKDPEPEVIVVEPEHRVVIVEGLYLLIPEWEIAPLFDRKLFLDCDLETARERLVLRHVETGLCQDQDEARRRVMENDQLNAEFVLRHF
ncbi:MAG: AAA family ATPase [Verrucomicrobiota bacterium]